MRLDKIATGSRFRHQIELNFRTPISRIPSLFASDERSVEKRPRFPQVQNPNRVWKLLDCERIDCIWLHRSQKRRVLQDARTAVFLFGHHHHSENWIEMVPSTRLFNWERVRLQNRLLKFIGPIHQQKSVGLRISDKFGNSN